MNLFVAGFIGMPQMNFYDAQLVKGADGKYAVELENAHVVLSDEKQARLSQKGVELQAITLGVRPEHITLEGDPEKMVHGTVDVREMMGSAVHLHITACGRDMIIIVQTMDLKNDTNFSIGSPISSTFNGKVAHVFARETGVNLEA